MVIANFFSKNLKRKGDAFFIVFFFTKQKFMIKSSNYSYA